jgi:hypothetical protein
VPVIGKKRLKPGLDDFQICHRKTVFPFVTKSLHGDIIQFFIIIRTLFHFDNPLRFSAAEADTALKKRQLFPG